MGFTPNSSDEAVVKEGKLYTGLRNMKVVAINPSKQELEQLGYRPQSDPVYTSMDEDGIKKVRLDFFLHSDLGEDTSVRTKIAFFLEDKDRVNQNGTMVEWINDSGRSAWGTLDAPPTELKWFDAETARKCKVGEADLHDFLINWLNINPKDEAKLENFSALFDGNYSELKTLLQAYPDNEVKVLLTVRDGRFQSVYNKYFDRATNQRTTYWENHIKKQTEQGYPPKDDFSGSLVFQEWVQPEASLATASGEMDDDGSAEGSDPF